MQLVLADTDKERNPEDVLKDKTGFQSTSRPRPFACHARHPLTASERLPREKGLHCFSLAAPIAGLSE